MRFLVEYLRSKVESYLKDDKKTEKEWRAINIADDRCWWIKQRHYNYFEKCKDGQYNRKKCGASLYWVAEHGVKEFHTYGVTSERKCSNAARNAYEALAKERRRLSLASLYRMFSSFPDHKTEVESLVFAEVMSQCPEDTRRYTLWSEQVTFNDGSFNRKETIENIKNKLNTTHEPGNCVDALQEAYSVLLEEQRGPSSSSVLNARKNSELRL